MQDFKNALYYCKLAAIQVNFVKKKNIFSNHIPIWNEETYQIFNVIPIPNQNTIIIPEHPYPYPWYLENSICSELEHIFMCKNHEGTKQHTCILPILRAEEQEEEYKK